MYTILPYISWRISALFTMFSLQFITQNTVNDVGANTTFLLLNQSISCDMCPYLLEKYELNTRGLMGGNKCSARQINRTISNTTQLRVLVRTEPLILFSSYSYCLHARSMKRNKFSSSCCCLAMVQLRRRPLLPGIASLCGRSSLIHSDRLCHVLACLWLQNRRWPNPLLLIRMSGFSHLNKVLNCRTAAGFLSRCHVLNYRKWSGVTSC